MKPKVSVCIPTYNRASMLLQTIEAILSQTCEDWELVVCDDASSDNTKEVAKSFTDKRIHYYRNETNLGLYPNWHRCMAMASGEYVAIYHDHDIYLPTILERSVDLLDKYPSTSFVHTALLSIDDSNTVVGVDIRPFSELTLGSQMMRLLASSWSSPVMAATTMVRRDAYREVGPYRYDQYGLSCDMDMWFRLSRIGDVAYVREPQALIRARVKGQATARFSWAEVRAGLAMHRDHIDQAFAQDRVTRVFEHARYAFRRDMRLASLMIRAILLEPPDVVKEGEALVKQEAGWWVALLTAMVQSSRLSRTLLRKAVLPVHYYRVARQSRSRTLKARKYLRSSKLLDALPD